MKRFGFMVALVALGMMLVGGLAAAGRGNDEAIERLAEMLYYLPEMEDVAEAPAAAEVLQLRELIKKLEAQVFTLEERVAELEREKGLARYLRFSPDVRSNPPAIVIPRQFRTERFEPRRGPDRGVKRRINGFEFYFQPVEKSSSPAPRDGRHRNR